MAAGLGFKDFATGEVLTAADVDGYLMQGIWVFASNAARDAAVTAPAEGNFAFTKDTNSLWYYDGAAWVASSATGDIEGVTAGVGISGGGTSGTVTVTNSMATAIDAKGDLIVGTGADTFSRLAVGGTNGHILTVDSGEATGVKWAAPAGGGGKVLQVVEGFLTGNVGSTSATFADTGLTVTITPTLATSKVLVIASCSSVMKTAVNTNVGLKLLRGSTQIFYNDYIAHTNGSVANNVGSVSLVKLDSPATTSATTYKVQMANMAATGTTLINEYAGAAGNTVTSSIIAMEIGA
jgi:hypothetical protein